MQEVKEAIDTIRAYCMYRTECENCGLWNWCRELRRAHIDGAMLSGIVIGVPETWPSLEDVNE